MSLPENTNQSKTMSVGVTSSKSLKSYGRQQGLPSFSEFLSFTFPGIAHESRKESTPQVKRLTKIRSVSLVSSPINDNPTINSTYKHGISIAFKDEGRDIRFPSEANSEDRTSFKRVKSHDRHGSLEKDVRMKTQLSRNAAMLDSFTAEKCLTSSAKRIELSFTEPTTSYPARSTTAHGNGEPPPKKRKRFASETRSYKCSFCPLAFLYQKHLIAHVKEKHEDQKPFGCPRNGCRQRFGGLGDVNRHVKTVHDGEKRFSCYLCQRCFSRRSGVKRHVIHIHGAVQA